jgi:protease-4
MGRTFLKGTLEKIGLGYDEWRFFKYKSANEVLVNDKMSPADKEQRQHLVDANYAQAKKDICEGRGITPQQFDEMVNNKFIFLPQEAIDNKLVDTLARVVNLSDVVEKLEGEKKNLVGPGAMDVFRLPPDGRWGAKPEIAVIYALGECAMDAGINARSLVRMVHGVVRDPKVKAIVLRVDSPGGDALASDYIAEALKEAKGKKPVIVSQGYVAGSGGYWLSMYADTIVAAPTTITGSIGVIGGWLYNKGLKESLGMSVDFVKAGGHADLGYGFSLPFIGVGVPDRNLSLEERQVMEHAIKTYYKEFVAKVASGRKKTIAEIDSIAQGHVYPGAEGKEIGLIDVLGGLETAIGIAKERAGIPREQEVTLIEVPKLGLFDIGMFVPKLFGVDAPASKNEIIEQLKFRLEHNGEAMPILPLDDCGYQFK